jgi:hypothetical protein
LAQLSGAAAVDAAAGPWLPYVSGLAYAANKDYTHAAEQFRNLIARPGDQPTILLRTLARLHLARAARDAGDAAGARTAYADFTSSWRHAAPGDPLLAAATREAAALPASGASAAPSR